MKGGQSNLNQQKKSKVFSFTFMQIQYTLSIQVKHVDLMICTISYRDNPTEYRVKDVFRRRVYLFFEIFEYPNYFPHDFKQKEKKMLCFQKISNIAITGL